MQCTETVSGFNLNRWDKEPTRRGRAVQGVTASLNCELEPPRGLFSRLPKPHALAETAQELEAHPFRVYVKSEIRPIGFKERL